MKKKLMSLILVGAMIMGLTACGSSAGSSASSDSSASTGDAAAEESAEAEEGAEASEETSEPAKKGEYNLDFSLCISKDNFQAISWQEWADLITEKTNGRVTFTFYYDDTAIDPNAEYQQLVAGIVDIADVHRYVNDGFVITENWKSFTAGIPAESERWMSYQLWDNYPEYRKEFDGVKVLAQSFNGGTVYQILSVDKKIESPADMKGLTVWCEADWNGFVKACGATPVNTPFAEVYSSLQKHMYDAMMIPTETLKSCNFAEVCKYCVKVDLCYATAPGHLMNLDTWNSLPEDIQAVFDDPEVIDFVERKNHEGFKEVEESAMQWAEENHGTEEVILTEENQQAFYDLVRQANLETAKALDAKGLPGTDMLNSLAQWSEEFNGEF